MPTTLLYIHGFLSSPQSEKAVITGNWLAVHRPQWRFVCPALRPYPHETRDRLTALVEEALPRGPVCLMGSSLGGYWATWLAEKYDLRAVLINPLVDPALFGAQYLDIPLKNYHTPETYTLSQADVDGLREVDTPTLQHPENYLVLVQTGDEVLDYRLAVRKYQGARLLIDEGGDHSYGNLQERLPEAIAFLEGNNSTDHADS